MIVSLINGHRGKKLTGSRFDRYRGGEQNLQSKGFSLTSNQLCTWSFMILNITGMFVTGEPDMELTETAVGHGLGDHIEAALARGQEEFGLLYRVCPQVYFSIILSDRYRMCGSRQCFITPVSGSSSAQC